MTISESVIKLRRSLGLEQQELAEILGITHTSISNYENGKRHPRIRIVRKMLELAKKHKIKLTLEDFFD